MRHAHPPEHETAAGARRIFIAGNRAWRGARPPRSGQVERTGRRNIGIGEDATEYFSAATAEAKDQLADLGEPRVQKGIWHLQVHLRQDNPSLLPVLAATR